MISKVTSYRSQVGPFLTVAKSSASRMLDVPLVACASLPNGAKVWVQSFGGVWRWRTDYLAATATDNVTTCRPTAWVAGGLPGAFVRDLQGSATARLQATWFVDSTAADEEGDGLTVGTPVKTDVEIQRRWGVRPSIANPITITYAQSPAGLTNFNFEVMLGGSVTFLGTPTVTKTGTTITAVQTQSRTAGAELGWAITATGLGATEVGKLAVITSSGTPANVGAYACVLKDEGSGKVRVSPFGTYAQATSTITAVTPLVGDVLEIRENTTRLQVGAIEYSSCFFDVVQASPARQVVVFDSLLLDSLIGTQNGSISPDRVATHYVRSQLKSLQLGGLPGQVTTHYILGGGAVSGGAIALRNGSNSFFRQAGFLSGITIAQGSRATLFPDCYFQSVGLTLSAGSCCTSQGVAFFDRVTSSNTLIVGGGSFYSQSGAIPDWGTANAGYAVVVQPWSGYSYATKPTINSGLGAGRETKVGGADKLYTAIPYTEPTNAAALVSSADAGIADGPATYYQSYTNVAALKAISAARLFSLQDGQRVFVATLKARFAWDAASAVADDTTDFLSVAVTANGASAGRFVRLAEGHPSWLAQATWFVSTAGSNENSGLTSLLPVKTDAEIQRRWGQGRPRISTAVTITYVQSPAGQTNYTFEVATSGSVTFIGTPTVSKAGTVLTAVQTQVRTAGSELGWAITATGLGATEVGKLAVITSSGVGANVGAYAAVLKDETGGKVRVSPFGTYATATTFTQVTPQVGDTIEIRDIATVLNISTVELSAAFNDAPQASPTRQLVVFDSLTLDGNVNSFNGCITNNRIGVHYARSVLNNLSLAGSTMSVSQHNLCSGFIGTGGIVVRGGAILLVRQTGVRGAISALVGGNMSVRVDTYFQNAALVVAFGSSVGTQGAAFFDRSSANATINVAVGSCLQHTGAIADWGAANAGYAVTIQSASSYAYATKPTINSGLGVGREAKIGGTDKLYSAVPYVETANNAALVLTA